MKLENSTPLQQMLFDNGYKYYTSEMYDVLKKTPHLFQKRFEDDIGVRYFINVWWYDETTLSNGSVAPEGLQMECNLYDNECEQLIEVSPRVDSCWDERNKQRIHTEDCIDKAEKLVYDLWTFTGKGYYELW